MRAHGRLISLLVAVLLVGCGGDDDPAEPAAAGTPAASATATDERIADAAFVKAWEAETGVKLDTTPSSTWTLMSPTLKASEKSYGEYGSFSLYVMKSLDESLDILTSDEDGKPLEAEADGLYYLPNPDGTHTVTKVYEPNVLVVWQGPEEKETTDTFDRLDAAITASIEAASAR